MKTAVPEKERKKNIYIYCIYVCVCVCYGGSLDKNSCGLSEEGPQKSYFCNNL